MFPQKPAGDHPAAAGDLPARPTESFAMPAKRPILPAGKANASGACMMSKSAKIYGTLALVLIGFPLFLALWRDRKSVVSGKSVSVRVDLGGRRIIKKNTNSIKTQYTDNVKKSTREHNSKLY